MEQCGEVNLGGAHRSGRISIILAQSGEVETVTDC